MALFTEIKESNLPLKKLFLFSLVINLVVVIISSIGIYILPPEIPLFYGLPKTEDELAPAIFILLPSVISIVITMINFVTSVKIDGVYLKKSLAFASVIVTILALVATFKIIFLVGAI